MSKKEVLCVASIGDRVELKKNNQVGVVRFIGEIKNKNGIYYGIELDLNKGKNNGTLNGIKYFKCKSNYGLFVKSQSISKIICKHNSHLKRIKINDKIKCIKTNCDGIVKFIGTPYSFKTNGIYYGLLLQKPFGTNNGTINNRYYFKSNTKCAIFVQSKDIKIISTKIYKNKNKNKNKNKKSNIKKDYKSLYLEMIKENQRLKQENIVLKEMINNKKKNEFTGNTFIFMIVSIVYLAVGG